MSGRDIDTVVGRLLVATACAAAVALIGLGVLLGVLLL